MSSLPFFPPDFIFPAEFKEYSTLKNSEISGRAERAFLVKIDRRANPKIFDPSLEQQVAEILYCIYFVIRIGLALMVVQLYLREFDCQAESDSTGGEVGLLFLWEVSLDARFVKGTLLRHILKFKSSFKNKVKPFTAKARRARGRQRS
jgi:hypothetical protein